MIKKYKENTTTYIKKCEECNSKFTYQYKDVEKYRYMDVKYSIECPYCSKRNDFNHLRKFIDLRKFIGKNKNKGE